MNIWQFSALLSQRLVNWNVANFAVGILMLVFGGRFWRGVGTQHLGWSVVNFAIALFGTRANEERAARRDAVSPLIREAQAQNLRRLLWINAGLDVLYMLGGVWFALRAKTAGRRGIGVGILVQGLLLFIFDITQAREVPER